MRSDRHRFTIRVAHGGFRPDKYFDGSKTYKVTLPPNIPAREVLVTHALRQPDALHAPNAATLPARWQPSYPGPAASANPDGSTTMYFSAAKPAGVKDGNWI